MQNILKQKKKTVRSTLHLQFFLINVDSIILRKANKLPRESGKTKVELLTFALWLYSVNSLTTFLTFAQQKQPVNFTAG